MCALSQPRETTALGRRVRTTTHPFTSLRISASILFAEERMCGLLLRFCTSGRLPCAKRPPPVAPETASKCPVAERLLRLAGEGGGIDSGLLGRLLRLANERAFLPELLVARAFLRLAAVVAADPVGAAALVLHDAAAGIVELEQGGLDVPLGRFVALLRVGGEEGIARGRIAPLADLLEEQLLRLPLLVVAKQGGELCGSLEAWCRDGAEERAFPHFLRHLPLRRDVVERRCRGRRPVRGEAVEREAGGIRILVLVELAALDDFGQVGNDLLASSRDEPVGGAVGALAAADAVVLDRSPAPDVVLDGSRRGVVGDGRGEWFRERSLRIALRNLDVGLELLDVVKLAGPAGIRGVVVVERGPAECDETCADQDRPQFHDGGQATTPPHLRRSARPDGLRMLRPFGLRPSAGKARSLRELAVTRQVSERAQDLRAFALPHLAAEAHRIASLGADDLGPASDQIPHHVGRDLGMELDARDSLRKPERLRRDHLVRREELRALGNLVDDVDMGGLHRDLAAAGPGEERVYATVRRQLDADGADLAALRIAHDVGAARATEKLVTEADAQDGNARGTEPREAIAELVHPGLGFGERERRPGDDDPFRPCRQLRQPLALVCTNEPELRAQGLFEPIGIVAMPFDQVLRRRASLDDEEPG